MCAGAKGNTTQTSTTGPPPQVLQNYQDVYSQAANLAASGLGAQTYPGQTVAPFSSNQEWAINNPFAAQQAYGGYANTAQNYYQAATQPLWNQGVSSAFQGPINIAGQNLGAATQANLSPYIQSVVDATQAQFNNQNAIQQQGVIGNAISSNAWGGDRSGVAQGITAGQQQLAEAPVIAGLYNQGYQTAQQATLAQMQQQEAAGEAGAQAQLGAGEANAWLNSQAAAGMSNVGATEAGLVQGDISNATQLGALQQQQAQANLNVPYANWLQQTSYPYQATNWLANISEGIGGLSGGTGTTTTPGPSTGSQLAGLGIGGVGLLGATGAFGSNGYLSNLFNGGGGGPSSFLIPGSDTSIGAASFLGSSPFHRGGSVRYGIGGSPQPLSSPTGLPMGSGLPMGDTIPNLSVSIVPQTNAPTASRSPFIGLGPQTTTQTQQSGSGGILGGLGSAVSTGLGIAKLATLFDRGGGIHGYDEGGDVGFLNLPDVDNVGDPSAPSAGMPPPMYGGAPGAHLTPSEGIAPYHADPWMALAAAGFGAAAGRSPHALQNIGQGGLEGMQFYESQRRYEPQARLELAKAQMAETQAGLLKQQVDIGQDPNVLKLLLGNVNDAQKAAKTQPASISAGPPSGQANVSDPRGLVPYITQAAQKNGIDPAVAIKVAASEGLGAPAGASGDGGTSGNAFQLHVTPGGKGDAVGDQFVAKTGLNPLDPANEKATIDFAMQHAARNGWGAWAGAQKAGIAPYQGIAQPSGQKGSAPTIDPAVTAMLDQQYSILQSQKVAIAAMPLPIQDKAARISAIDERIMQYRLHDPRLTAAAAGASTQATKNVELGMNPQIAGATKQAENPPTLELKGGEAAIDINKAQQMLGAETQKTAYENTDKAAQTQVTKYQDAGLAARGDVATAQMIRDLIPKVRLGWGADTRAEASRIVFTLAQMSGATDEDARAAANAITKTDPTNADALNKLFLQFSSQAVRAMGAREPGSVISLFQKAYPNLETNPKAAELMTNALMMQAKWKADMGDAAEQYLQQSRQDYAPGTPHRGMAGFLKSYGETNDPGLYEGAAEAMSREPVGWRHARSAQQRDQIYNLIPSGEQFLNPRGELAMKP